jgi:hypothetical protein
VQAKDELRVEAYGVLAACARLYVWHFQVRSLDVPAFLFEHTQRVSDAIDEREHHLRVQIEPLQSVYGQRVLGSIVVQDPLVDERKNALRLNRLQVLVGHQALEVGVVQAAFGAEAYLALDVTQVREEEVVLEEATQVLGVKEAEGHAEKNREQGSNCARGRRELDFGLFALRVVVVVVVVVAARVRVRVFGFRSFVLRALFVALLAHFYLSTHLLLMQIFLEKIFHLNKIVIVLKYLFDLSILKFE